VLEAVDKHMHNDLVRFAWDEAKRQSNLRKHGLDFADAEAVFAGLIFTFEDERFDYRERRRITIGLIEGLVVFIAHTESNEVIRVISMRKATKREQKLFFESVTN